MNNCFYVTDGENLSYLFSMFSESIPKLGFWVMKNDKFYEIIDVIYNVKKGKYFTVCIEIKEDNQKIEKYREFFSKND